MNFEEWWSAYNREQIFYKNYSHRCIMAIKALAEDAWRAGRDASLSQCSRSDNPQVPLDCKGIIHKTDELVIGKAASHQNVRFEFCYPDGWWQYFKQDYFPEWLLERFPLKERGVIEDKKITFHRISIG